MGDLLRRLSRRLLQVMMKAAMPGIIIYAVMLLSFMRHGLPDDALLTPRTFFLLLVTSYLTAFFVALVLEAGTLRQAASRVDGHLIGSTFGGWRKQDKLFCDGMELLSGDHVHEALEQFLAVKEFELTDTELGVVSFYLGRCYQLLNCPANAVPYYETACEKGFSRPFAKLFLARSYADGGQFDESYRIFCELLENDPPKEFFFLYTDIGFLFLRQKQPEKAVEWFQKSIALHQNYAFALSGMAIAALQTGDFAEAKAYRYKALINELKDPSTFRKYFDETKALMLEEHPEWAEQPAKPSGEAKSRSEGA